MGSLVCVGLFLKKNIILNSKDISGTKLSDSFKVSIEFCIGSEGNWYGIHEIKNYTLKTEYLKGNDEAHFCFLSFILFNN